MEFRTASHNSLSYARLTQSTPSHSTAMRSILVLSSNLTLS
jgi:hypothetical protein